MRFVLSECRAANDSDVNAFDKKHSGNSGTVAVGPTPPEMLFEISEAQCANLYLVNADGNRHVLSDSRSPRIDRPTLGANKHRNHLYTHNKENPHQESNFKFREDACSRV